MPSSTGGKRDRRSRSLLRKPMVTGCFGYKITALVLVPPTRSESLDSSSASTATKNIPAPALGWPSANESWIDIAAVSGSSRNLGKDLPSSSPSPPEPADPKKWHIVVMEDNKADVFLVEEAMAVHDIHAELQVITDGEEAMRRIEEA